MDALKIAFKDLRLLTRDRRSAVVLLILPIVLISVIGSSTGRMMDDSASEKARVPVHLLDYCDSAFSQRLTGFLAANAGIDLTTGRPDDLAAGQSPEISAIPPGNFDAEIVLDASLATAANANSDELSVGGFHSGAHVTVSPGTNPLLERYLRLLITQSMQQARMPIDIPEAKTVESPVTDSGAAYRFVVPGFTVLFVFFIVTIMGRSFLQERELGTLRRLRIAPVSAVSILAGKTVPFLLVSVAQTTVLILTGHLLFGMPLGTAPWLIIPVVLLTSAAATTLGLAFATWVRTESQVAAWGNLLVLGAAGISGCLVPRRWMPDLTQTLSRATPHAWALEAYQEILANDAPQTSVLALCCAVLAGFATLFFLIGLAGFRQDAGIG